MSVPKKVSQERYDEIRSDLEEKYNYDEMSAENKKRFNTAIDRIFIVGSDNNDNDDEDDFGNDGLERDRSEVKYRSKMEEKYNYNEMSNEEKKRFDLTMDHIAIARINRENKNDTENDEIDKNKFEDRNYRRREIDDDREL